MYISANESYSEDGLSVSIIITPTPPRHQELFYYPISIVMKVTIDEDFPSKRNSAEYVASVFRKHLPGIYNQLKKHNYDMVLNYNVEYY